MSHNRTVVEARASLPLLKSTSTATNLSTTFIRGCTPRSLMQSSRSKGTIKHSTVKIVHAEKARHGYWTMQAEHRDSIQWQRDKHSLICIMDRVATGGKRYGCNAGLRTPAIPVATLKSIWLARSTRQFRRFDAHWEPSQVKILFAVNDCY